MFHVHHNKSYDEPILLLFIFRCDSYCFYHPLRYSQKLAMFLFLKTYDLLALPF